jgi:probable phosphoglycerate mutase
MEQLYYIIRHGETDYNKQGMVQGSGIDSELNEKGRKQAEAFYEKYKNEPFKRIYVSGLKRTAQSVKGFLDKGIPYNIIEELNEIGWGDFEGQIITPEMHQRYLNIIGEWQKGNLEEAYLNAETPLQMEKRQKIALKKILENNTDGKVLIVTHGRYLRAFLCLLLGHPLKLMDDFIHSNLCLYILSYDGERFKLIREHDTSHLEGI